MSGNEAGGSTNAFGASRTFFSERVAVETPHEDPMLQMIVSQLVRSADDLYYLCSTLNPSIGICDVALDLSSAMQEGFSQLKETLENSGTASVDSRRKARKKPAKAPASRPMTAPNPPSPSRPYRSLSATSPKPDAVSATKGNKAGTTSSTRTAGMAGGRPAPPKAGQYIHRGTAIRRKLISADDVSDEDDVSDVHLNVLEAVMDNQAITGDDVEYDGNITPPRGGDGLTSPIPGSPNSPKLTWAQRVRDVHSRLSSPDRRRRSAHTIMQESREKQARAEERRKQLETSRSLGARAVSERAQRVVEKQEAEKRERMQTILTEQNRKLQVAEERRQVRMEQIVEKAKNEVEKVKETAFIQSMEADIRQKMLDSKLEDSEARRAEMLGEVRRRQADQRAKQEAVAVRRHRLEEERRIRIQEKLDRVAARAEAQDEPQSPTNSPDRRRHSREMERDEYQGQPSEEALRLWKDKESSSAQKKKMKKLRARITELLQGTSEKKDTGMAKTDSHDTGDDESVAGQSSERPSSRQHSNARIPRIVAEMSALRIGSVRVPFPVDKLRPLVQELLRMVMDKEKGLANIQLLGTCGGFAQLVPCLVATLSCTSVASHSLVAKMTSHVLASMCCDPDNAKELMHSPLILDLVFPLQQSLSKFVDHTQYLLLVFIRCLGTGAECAHLKKRKAGSAADVQGTEKRGSSSQKSKQKGNSSQSGRSSGATSPASMVEREVSADVEVREEVLSYLVACGVLQRMHWHLTHVTFSTSARDANSIIPPTILMIANFFLCVSSTVVADNVYAHAVFKPFPSPPLLDTLREILMTGTMQVLVAVVAYMHALLRASSQSVSSVHCRILYAGVRVLNDLLRIGRKDVLEYLDNDSRGGRVEFQNVITHLVSFCCHHPDLQKEYATGRSSDSAVDVAVLDDLAVWRAERQPTVRDLLHEVVLLIGYVVLESPSTQETLRYGSEPVVKNLVKLPIPYFTAPSLVMVLYPTLIASCYQNTENSAILERELSPESVCEFIAESTSPSTSLVGENSLGDYPWARFELRQRIPKKLWGGMKDYFRKL